MRCFLFHNINMHAHALQSGPQRFLKRDIELRPQSHKYMHLE